jgi:hypothetical protein
MRPRSWSAGRIAAGATGLVVLLLALAQLLLPGIAARRIRARVSRYGTIRSVSVSAWPAVKLLWGSADSVTVKAAALRLTTAQTAKVLSESGGAGDVKLTAESVDIGVAHVSSATFEKHGDALNAAATVTQAEVRQALPEGVQVQLLESADGAVRVQASGALFGVPASVQAVAEAREGSLVVHPLGLLIETLRLTLFSEPHVYVEGVGASQEGGASPSYRLTISARLQ